MKNLTRRILISSLLVVFSACLLFIAVMNFSRTEVKADTAELEAEFTNGGQFTISTSVHNCEFAYIDGESVGGEGAVLQANFAIGVTSVKLDLSPAKLSLGDVKSIVVRVKLLNYRSGNEFRTLNGSAWVQYGKNYDLSTWQEFTLNDKTLKAMVNEDGTLGSTNICIRTESDQTSAIMYIDSITVNSVDYSKLEVQKFKGVYPNSSYNKLEKALLTYSGNTTWDDSDDGNLKYKITLINTSTEETSLLADTSGAIINHWEEQKWIYILLPGTYDKMVIAEGAHYAGVAIPSGTLVFDEGWRLETSYTLGTPTFTVPNAINVGSYGWNHKTDNGAVIKSSDYGYTIISNWKTNVSVENLAATKNATSINIKLNGVSFYDLYTADDGYRINAQLEGFFGFSVPTAALVADKEHGYNYPTIEITEGTPFYEDNYLPATTSVYKDNLWQLYVSKDVEATFVNIDINYNNDSNGFFIAKFNVDGWKQSAVPTSYTGIKYNGNDITDLTTNIKFYLTNSVWFTYTPQDKNQKLVAGYNGYSHPTIEFTDGATMVYEGYTYIFKPVKFYLNLDTNKWQTEVPDGYEIVEPTTFVGIDKSSTKNSVILLFEDDSTWAEEGNNLSERIILDGNTTLLADGGSVTVDNNNKKITVSLVGDYSKIQISSGGKASGVLIPEVVAYFGELGWSVTPQKVTELVGIGVFGNNNIPLTSGVYHTVLQFKDFFVIGGTNNDKDVTNMAASSNYDVSTKVKLNGRTFRELYQENQLFYVGYMSGGKYFTFQIPKTYLDGEPENGYLYHTIEIEEGAVFMDLVLPEVSIVSVDLVWTDAEEFKPKTNLANIDKSTTNNTLIINFNDEHTWTGDDTNISSHILLDGSVTLSADGGNVNVDKENKKIIININGSYSKFQFTSGCKVCGLKVPELSTYGTSTGWALTPQIVNEITGIGVFGNNNLPLGTGVCHTVLQFKDFFVIGGDNNDKDATNMAASTDYDVATKVKLNGRTFYDLYQENNLFYIGYMSGGRFFTFQIPKTYLDGDPENGYLYHTIEVEEGTIFMDRLLPSFSILSFENVWMSSSGFNPDPLPYSGIAYGWNCVKNNTNIDTILQFGEYGVDYLGGENGVVTHADASNLAILANEQIATKLTINGVAIKEIDGAIVSYAHGYNYLYISIPEYELSPNEEYKCVVLHIENNTVFKSSVLSEVTLYLLDGLWQTEKPATVETDEEGTYFTAKDIFNGEESVYVLTEEDKGEIVSLEKSIENSSIYNFLYKSDSIDFDCSLFTYVGNGFGGVRVVFYHNEGESTQGFNVYIDGQLEGSNQIAFVLDEWYAMRIAVEIEDGKILVSVAIDGIVIITTETSYEGEVGDEIKIKKSYGELTFADFRTGDIKKPKITWQGKEVYRFIVGDDKPSDLIFRRVLSATDNYDKGSLTADDFTIEWQEGAIKEGRLEVGEWLVTFSISDSAGNISHYTTKVLVTNPTEIVVTYIAEGKVEYVTTIKGKLITKPLDPSKEGDENVDYIFDGWYLGEKKWDFANDYTFEDISLTAVFKTENKEYIVALTSEGLENNYTYNFKLRLGSTLDESILKREGYTYKVIKDGTEIDKITVDGNLQIKVVYTKDEEEPIVTPEKPGCGGCGGNVNGTFIGLVLLVIVLGHLFKQKFLGKGGQRS